MEPSGVPPPCMGNKRCHSPVFTVNTPNWSQLGQTGLRSPLPVPIKVGVGPPTCPSLLSPSALAVSPPRAVPTMLFWHGQPEHYWSSPGDLYPLPGSGVLRYPPNPPPGGKPRHGRAPSLAGGVFAQGPPRAAVPEAGGAQRHPHVPARVPVRAGRPDLPGRAAPRGDPHLPQPG